MLLINIITNFEDNKNNYDFYTFETDGRELNIKFLEELGLNK